MVNSTIPDGKIDIVFVGEAPGRDEEFQLAPFVGAAGKKLRACLDKAGIDEKRVAFINATRHRPPKKNGKQMAPKTKEIIACRKYLRQEIESIKPNLIVALGKSALTAVHKPMALQALRGATFMCKEFEIKTIATSHPSAVLQHYASEEIFLSDLRKAKVESATPDMPDTSTDYVVIDSANCGSEGEALKELEALRDHLLSSKEFSFDFETTGLNYYKDDVLAVGFSSGQGMSFIVPFYGQFQEIRQCETPQEAWAILGTQTGTLNPFWTSGARTQVIHIVKEILESDVPKVAFNGKFDTHFARHRLGIDVRNLGFDPMLAHHTFYEDRPHDLNHVLSLYTTMPIYDMELHDWLPAFNYSYAFVPDDILHYYLGSDCDATLRVRHRTNTELEKAGRWNKWVFEQIAMPLQRSFIRMEETGAPIDREHLLALGEHFEQKITKIEASLRKFVLPLATDDFDPHAEKLFGSVPQLHNLLYSRLELPLEIARDPRSKKDDEAATDVHSIERLLHSKRVKKEYKPFLNSILDLRQARKLKTHFVGSDTVRSKTKDLLRSVQEDDRIHCSMNIHGTATGRPSASDPNLQQIESDPIVKNIFRAPEGYKILESDFSQIEIRVLAYLSRDPVLLEDVCSCSCGEVFVDRYAEFEQHLHSTGHARGDVHSNMAMRLYGVPREEVTPDIRRSSKSSVFAFNYGGNAFTLEARGIKNAKEIEKNYFERYQKIMDLRKQAERWLDEKEVVYNVFGRQRHYPGWKELKDKERGKTDERLTPEEVQKMRGIRREIQNTPCQSTAADLMSLSTIALCDYDGVNYMQQIPGYPDVLIHNLMFDLVGDYPASILKYEYGVEPFLTIHDSILMTVPDEYVEKTKLLVEKVMMGVGDMLKMVEGPYGSFPHGWYLPCEMKVAQAWGGDSVKDISKGVHQNTRSK